MGFWDKILKKNKNTSKGEGIKPDKSLDKNVETIKDLLQDCDDIVYREVEIGSNESYRIAIAYVDGMADKILLNEFVLTNLMFMARMVKPEPNALKNELSSLVKNRGLAVTEIKEAETIDEAVISILSGETVLILDNYDKIIIVASKGWPARGVSEPVTETVIRGPRDGFTETLRVNSVLIRRRIRDQHLKLRAHKVGKRSNTDLALMYIEDIVDPKILEEVNKRIEQIDIDTILDSGYIEQLIQDSYLSPFPQIQNTERPDVAAAALYEGRIVIIVDNTPFALIVPTTFNAMMQSSEDYYERWLIATAVRMLRYFAVIISLTLPSLYVAITSFHPQMIPSKLALAVAANRVGVPFPAIVEALIMEVTIELLREAGIHLPGPIGATIGIVGGLVIGQAAVEAGIVGPLMVIVVAVTAIASFAIPSYNVSIGFRLIRFLFIFAAGFLGLFGITLAVLILLIHLCSLKSFGIPYLSPFITFVEDFSDLKDTFVRLPMAAMKNRSIISERHKKNRLDDKRPENFNKEDNE